MHHLDTDFVNYPNFRLAVKNLHTVLKSGGKLCINTFFRDNFEGIWFMLHQAVNERHIKRYPPRNIFLDAFQEAGFVKNTQVIDHELIFGNNYWDTTLPFSEEKRRSGSYFTDIGDDLDAYLNIITQMQNEGTFDNYMERKKQIMDQNGHTTFVIG